jgi:crotonobetainyl-CoA:carnitine CoA-transferase CaiB-like acyl-CoA transferase
LRHGLTAPGGMLGGGLPGYGLYRARDGWVAVAALEDHFLRRLVGALGLRDARRADLAAAFLTRGAEEWQRWGAAHDLPIGRVASCELPVDDPYNSEPDPRD